MIVPLIKVTVLGLLQDKAKVLADLQDMGCLHLIPLQTEEGLPKEVGPTSEAREALKFLQTCPHKRRQVRDPEHFDPISVEHQALDLRDRIRQLADERDFLRRRISDLKPWGNFTFPPLEDLGDLRLWFYVVPHQEMKKVAAIKYTWEVVWRDNRFVYVVVVAETEPQDMPVHRVRTGAKSISALEHRLEEVELELEDLQAERASLTRWLKLFASSLNRLEDQAALSAAARQTYHQEPLFALQGWAPQETRPQLQKYADDEGLVLEAAAPQPGDDPPTLLRNPQNLAGGQDLVSFYTVPGYWVWDPSAIVFFSFPLFFGMILADAGYGLVLAAILALYWRRLAASPGGQQLRILFATLVVVAVVYGVLVGSYFGVSPAPGNLLAPLARLHRLDMNDFDTMMQLTIFIGVAHLMIANLMDAWHRRCSSEALAPLGWIMIFAGAVCLWLGYSGTLPTATFETVGTVAMVAGGAGVLLFTTVEGSIGQRFLGGLKGLTRLSAAFGDSLSYLRLFALGLASASLAVTFNSLAEQTGEMRGLGLLLALLILLLGHSLNFVLSLASGVIHGLRLNFIEFFNWSMAEGGYPFKPFARKER
jgi:V/A-type H+-transporting ATPase subunit I